ncbi:MAG: hypothetical protein ABJ246_11590 [Paracoccaceae bacterium]
MTSIEDITEISERMRDAIGKAYGFKARDLKTALRRAGRRLPKSVRSLVSPVLQAEAFGGNPKLLRRVDIAAIETAETALNTHLKTVDRSAVRRTALVRWFANIAIYVLFVFGSVGLWLALTGKIFS